jgi:mannose-6-phosphate isomerase-like protein (cupin superfamily)
MAEPKERKPAPSERQNERHGAGPQAKLLKIIQMPAKAINIYKQIGDFRLLFHSTDLQAATMVLAPGKSSDESVTNEHPRAEQWVFVISGVGIARIGQRRMKLKPGTLLFIPKYMAHQITNNGRGHLLMLNFYAPPAYQLNGEVKRSVRRSPG